VKAFAKYQGLVFYTIGFLVVRVTTHGAPLPIFLLAALLLVAAIALIAEAVIRKRKDNWEDVALEFVWFACIVGVSWFEVLSGGTEDLPNDVFWLLLVVLLIQPWRLMWALVRVQTSRNLATFLIPIVFSVCFVYLWQLVVVGTRIPQILLPAPSQIGRQLVAQAFMLSDDFQQTFLKSVLAGFAMGCGLGFIVAVLTDRVPFLQRGLLPLGNMVSAVPIVGIAPIMVMWFGFGWESKAAVIVVMTFFPMLINTIAGLNASDHMSRDLMRSYGSSYWQTFFMLRLPAALPFIFNALKINSTLALIGAIVAEMFGSPISGMGFRISTEVYKMNVDIVWATIAVAAAAGSAFYGLLALIERRLTFWHPSYRSASRAR